MTGSDTWTGNLNTPFTLNRYTYATNDPTTYWDPTGRWPLPCKWGLVGGVAGCVAEALLDLGGSDDDTEVITCGCQPPPRSVNNRNSQVPDKNRRPSRGGSSGATGGQVGSIGGTLGGSGGSSTRPGSGGGSPTPQPRFPDPPAVLDGRDGPPGGPGTPTIDVDDLVTTAAEGAKVTNPIRSYHDPAPDPGMPIAPPTTHPPGPEPSCLQPLLICDPDSELPPGLGWLDGQFDAAPVVAPVAVGGGVVIGAWWLYDEGYLEDFGRALWDAGSAGIGALTATVGWIGDTFLGVGDAVSTDGPPTGTTTTTTTVSPPLVDTDTEECVQPCEGMFVYRVYGPNAGSSEYGASWSPVDPRTLGPDEYRSRAGLPDSNPGTHLVIGELVDPKAVVDVRGALPCEPPYCAEYGQGGLPEFVIPTNRVAVVNRAYQPLFPPY